MDRATPKRKMKFAKVMAKNKLKPAELTARVTPTSGLFVLAHLGIPDVPADDWSLQIDGLVRNAISLNFSELLERPKVVVETVHQCAGSPLNPEVPTRRIANVRWGGVDLALLLAEAGVSEQASYLWSYGLDHGKFAGVAQDHYLKDMPLARLMEGDVLIAYELNDEPLPVEHGYPARLVVPGFFGTNSVKWLSHLHLADHRASSLFTTRFYNDTVSGSEATRPVWEILPESVFVSPAPGSEMSVEDNEIWGWAWSSCAVQRLEVSTDGGEIWNDAELEPRSNRAWQRFSYNWSQRRPGFYELRCRATDIKGETQPLDGARNAIYTIAVTIE